MENNIQDYVDNGFRIFPLWSFNEETGECSCSDEKCKMAGKHPRVSSWTQVPHWSDEQLENMIKHTIKTGYGVVVEKCLVVDVDPRNGGHTGLANLNMDLNMHLQNECRFTVETGGGGLHLYFKLPEGDTSSYYQHLDRYKGIDFKTSGFVVGAGSLHASGKRYETQDFVHEMREAPASLLEALVRPLVRRANYEGRAIDITDKEMSSMLHHINPDCEYEEWIRCGMAVHDATGGASFGFDMWDLWSSRGDKYEGSEYLQNHWVSFGKSSSPVTIGTLIHYANEGGYTVPVTFSHTVEFEEVPESDLPFSIAGVDLLRPPGFVGKLNDWINSQCRYPRERLAVVSSLTCIGNIAGLRYTDDKDNISLNLLSVCVAASATGKEAIMQSAINIHEKLSLQRAVVGAIKSEQEIIRNLVRHQASYYIIDEIGYLLQKIENARKKGGATYLDGVVATIMAAFSKADGSFLVSGDLKETIASEIRKELSNAKAKVENFEDDSGYYAERAKDIEEKALPMVETGLERPFLSIMGMTTPVSFEGLVTSEQATNGFIGRCLIIKEPETNPKRKRGFKKPSSNLPDSLALPLQQLFDDGEYDGKAPRRIEYYGDKIKIPTEPEALEMLEDAADWLEDRAEEHKGKTGLEAIVRRSYEIMAKVSCILAIPSGLRTKEHVRWAFCLMKEDMDNKINMAVATIAPGSEEALKTRILESIGEGEAYSTVIQRTARIKNFTKQGAEKMLNILVANGDVIEKVVQNPRTKRTAKKYFIK